MKRRDFVRRLPVVSASLAAVSTAGLSACGGVPWLAPRPVPGGLEIASGDVAETGSVMVQGPGMERPIHLSRTASGDAVAVLASCTHRGCQPEPLGDRLACPCHGSEFTFAGEVISGPADRPLERYETVERDGSILIRIPGGAR